MEEQDSETVSSQLEMLRLEKEELSALVAEISAQKTRSGDQQQTRMTDHEIHSTDHETLDSDTREIRQRQVETQSCQIIHVYNY